MTCSSLTPSLSDRVQPTPSRLAHLSFPTVTVMTSTSHPIPTSAPSAFLTPASAFQSRILWHHLGISAPHPHPYTAYPTRSIVSLSLTTSISLLPLFLFSFLHADGTFIISLSVLFALLLLPVSFLQPRRSTPLTFLTNNIPSWIDELPY